MKTQIAAPIGMTGLAVEPWSKGEVYAVAANWAQASSPVMVYGAGEWDIDDRGRQVADFQHRPKDALESIIRQAIEAGGDNPDDDDVEAIMADAVDLMAADVAEMIEVLERHGDQAAGNNAENQAQQWIDNHFSSDDADSWCEIGCWDADTAAEFRDAGLSPEQAKRGAELLLDEECDQDSQYTDASPIYAACNGDIGADIIIESAKR